MLTENNTKLNNQQKKTGDLNSREINTIHRISLAVCILLYILLYILIVKINSGDSINSIEISGLKIYNNVIAGFIAQFQVIISVIIVLNPIRSSYAVSVALNIALSVGAFQASFIRGYSGALPGLVVPFSTIIIITVISKYARRLKSQFSKVTRFNQIMKENDEELHRLAYYDQLTELPNRRLVIDQLELLADPILSEKKSFVFAFFDLDNFKKINDTMGHSVGDMVLKQVARRWINLVNNEDLLGRLGGDEFGLLIRRDLDREELLAYLDGFRNILNEPITAARKDFLIKASFGVTIYPDDGADTTELLKNADIALYKAKNSGKNGILFFNREMQGEVLRKIQLENGLMSSIQNNELYMVFQPVYKCGSNALRGFEALARWRYSDIGLISPSQFIPIAEETGMIVEMGKWILKTVLKKFMNLQKLYDFKPIISVNISVIQMLEPGFTEMVKNILNETGFDSRYLELEITESVFITYTDHIASVIRELKEIGIRIALDDFGSGYTSLSYLQMFPINVLKLDKTFISKITKQGTMNHIVGNIITLAHQLGIEVVAEGVEEEEQLQFLNEHNCDYIQGFLLSRPVEEDQLPEHYNRSIA